MLVIVIFALVALALVAAGYLQVKQGANAKVANGVLVLALGVGLFVWFTSNYSA